MSQPVEIRAELTRAKTARISGNEGRARVYARRAAGMAAKEFLRLHPGLLLNTPQCKPHSKSTFEDLQTLSTFPGLSPDLKQAALRLTMLVNEEFQLPAGIDLIDEANILIGGLK